MCGVLAASSERYIEARTFLEQATDIGPPSVVAWTLLGEMEVSFPTQLTFSQYDGRSCNGRASQELFWMMWSMCSFFLLIWDPFFL